MRKINRIQKKGLILAGLLAVMMALFFTGCTAKEEKKNVKILLLPHFETGNFTDGNIGEAELLYQGLLDQVDQFVLDDGSILYYGEDNEIAFLLTGAGKSNASMTAATVLSDSRFDFSNALILCVGCAGGSTGTCVFGDVCIVTAAVDYDLGHTVYGTELANQNSDVTWFHDVSYDTSSNILMDTGLTEKVYELVKDTKLQTTDYCRETLSINFPDESWAQREPAVLKGTTVTSDNYWKGKQGHQNAIAITDYYDCPDPYAVSEMEDVALMYVFRRFGVLNHALSIRAVVNLDTFLSGDTPEKLWSETEVFASEATNDETLDIFVPAMQNLYDVCDSIIQAHMENSLF